VPENKEIRVATASMQTHPLPRFAEIAQHHLMMFETNEDGIIQFISEPLAHALGSEPPTFVGRNWLDHARLAGSTDHFLMSPFQLPDGAETNTFECTITSENGFDIPFEIYAIRLGTREPLFAMLCSAITERKQKEARLIARIEALRRAMEEKDVAMASLRHDTATALTTEILHEASQPLTAIRCYGDMAQKILKEKGHLDEDKLAFFLKTMVLSSQLTADILRRFCDSTRGRPANFAAEVVSELVDDVTQLLAFTLNDRRIKLQTKIDPGMARLDRTLIKQVLLNLIRNSIEATQVDKGEINISARRRLNCWEFSVSDNGPGVRNDKIGQLFLPGKSDKKDGVGVGLSVAQAIIRSHGGTIRYSSLQPTGARFRFHIPLDSKPARKRGLVKGPAAPQVK